MKKFLTKKIGNQISGIMPMWFYLLAIISAITPFVLKTIGV